MASHSALSASEIGRRWPSCSTRSRQIAYPSCLRLFPRTRLGGDPGTSVEKSNAEAGAQLVPGKMKSEPNRDTCANQSKRGASSVWLSPIVWE